MTKTDFDSQFGPIAMPKPFAQGGDVATIPFTQDGGNFNFDLGFDPAFSSPKSNNGKYVERAQLNAIGNLATRNDFHRRCGGLNTFDPAFAEAIGGYPKDAVLLLLKNSKVFYVISMVDNNKFDFVSRGVDNVNWMYLNMDAPTDESIINEGYVDKVVAQLNATSSNFGDVLRIGMIMSDYTGFVSIAPTCMFPGISSSYSTVSSYNNEYYFPFGASLFVKNIGPSSEIQENVTLPSFSSGAWTLNGFSQMDFPFYTSKYLHIKEDSNSGVTARTSTGVIGTTSLVRVEQGDYLYIATNAAIGRYMVEGGNNIVRLYPNSLVGDVIFRFVLG